MASVVIAYYWRVERGDEIAPVVHEFWRHHESGVFVPSPERPERPVHAGKVTTDVLFPVDIDLGSLVEV